MATEDEATHTLYKVAILSPPTTHGEEGMAVAG